MAIVYKKHSDIDFTKWDRAVDKAVNGSIYAYSWYLNTNCPGWDALITEDYSSIMPITHNRKFGIAYIFPPFFSGQLGVFSIHQLDESTLMNFLNAIPAKFKYLEQNLNTSCPKPSLLYSPLKKACQYISNEKEFVAAKATFSTNTKRNIEKALRAELEIKDGIHPDEVVTIFTQNKGKELKQFSDKEYGILNALFKHCLALKKGFTLGCVNRKGELLAAGFFTQSHGRVSYLKGGVNEAGKASGAMHLLMNHAIEKSLKQNHVFDFGGSSVESVARFNLGFTKSEYHYYQIKRNSLGILKWLK